jgi:hypothetical protein
MWRYRNNNTGDEVESPTKRPRLERLSNWTRIGQPAETVAAVPSPVVLPTAHVCRTSDGVDVTCVCVTGADHGEEDFDRGAPVPEPVDESAPAPVPAPVVACQVPRPSRQDTKASWHAYATSCGVDPTGKTKAQLVAACRG